MIVFPSPPLPLAAQLTSKGQQCLKPKLVQVPVHPKAAATPSRNDIILGLFQIDLKICFLMI